MYVISIVFKLERRRCIESRSRHFGNTRCPRIHCSPLLSLPLVAAAHSICFLPSLFQIVLTSPLSTAFKDLPIIDLSNWHLLSMGSPHNETLAELTILVDELNDAKHSFSCARGPQVFKSRIELISTAKKIINVMREPQELAFSQSNSVSIILIPTTDH